MTEGSLGSGRRWCKHEVGSVIWRKKNFFYKHMESFLGYLSVVNDRIMNIYQRIFAEVMTKNHSFLVVPLARCEARLR